ncbi:hypothetical protein CYLTODRAFT_403785 [Cylindrobasidium torrendii FP15055 ss-10]|uniref:N-acetyltransferase domain-containing protein n=1 Tax=Cylindrobasidium torrendii FP15055 ss-10 TaxID=1314674 RepID=A0A0D7AXS4_9AGAR|nr:hypothetical protein CYLTODRAFT_403785 [Cylindrobasidium torrendii FP15055 ss-10]
MPAYGDILTLPHTGGPLPSTQWVLSPEGAESVSTHHLTLQTALALPGLIEYFFQCFEEIVEEGTSWPHEGSYDQTSFQRYFFTADVLVGILHTSGDTPAGLEEPKEFALGVMEAKAGRSWAECIAGMYYIMPNYPGRSSHICNGGFIVPRAKQGKGYGRVLGRSYLHYAPKLGYQASIFNLVFVNNAASVRLWERLGFTKAWRIPRAARLKKKDGSEGEEYVDAYVFHKNFVDDQEHSSG